MEHQMSADEKSIIFFDGVCNLCNAFIDFIIRRDKKAKYYFAPLQGSSFAKSSRHVSQLPDSVCLLENGVLYFKSTAALRIISGLGGAWKLMGAFWIVPAMIRDAIYDWVASNRYGWFGKKDTCRLPTPEERARFLD